MLNEEVILESSVHSFDYSDGRFLFNKQLNEQYVSAFCIPAECVKNQTHSFTISGIIYDATIWFEWYKVHKTDFFRWKREKFKWEWANFSGPAKFFQMFCSASVHIRKPGRSIKLPIFDPISFLDLSQYFHCTAHTRTMNSYLCLLWILQMQLNASASNSFLLTLKLCHHQLLNFIPPLKILWRCFERNK